MQQWQVITILTFGWLIIDGRCNLPPVFTEDMNNLALSEATPVGWIVYTLEGYDPEGSEVTFGLVGTDHFMVHPTTGKVEVTKALDREEQDTLSFLVTIKDQVSATGGKSENDNLVEVPIRVIVLDENDNAPEFQDVPYETEVLESAPSGTTLFNSILATDRDTVGDNLNVSCIAETPSMITMSAERMESTVIDPCAKFSIRIVESNQYRLKASVVLEENLDYNEQMIHHLVIAVTDGLFVTKTGLEIRVVDIQNTPPIFQGPLAAVIDEDSPIGALVTTIQAKDGDHGQPRKIVYDLLSNPMDYFLLDSRSGELRTARPLDKEALPDATGLVVLTVRARELIDMLPGNDSLTVTTAQASITIRDVNDSPPTFNDKNYAVSLPENTPPGTPLPIHINVRDPDVGQNSIFSLRLDDVSGVFDVEPKLVTGSSQISIRVANATLDYENPNQRKFIVLIIAEETKTEEKLSSTATLTVTVTDANDNRPIFDQESYSFSVSETAAAGFSIASITARDQDSGRYGTSGVRYSLSGTGSELFAVDDITGIVSVADCPRASAQATNVRNNYNSPNNNNNENNRIDELSRIRTKRQFIDSSMYDMNGTKVNLTIVSQTGLINIDNVDADATTESYYPFSSSDEQQQEILVEEKSVQNTDAPIYHTDNDYLLVTGEADEDYGFSSGTGVSGRQQAHAIQSTQNNQMDGNGDDMHAQPLSILRPGKAPCLDYETQSVYFLSYKATDDNGNGLTSVTSLRITLTDANDSPPVCESAIYRASLDEGAMFFDPLLIVKARDSDTISDINYRIIGNDAVSNLFAIDGRSGQLSIRETANLDVNHLRSENIEFNVEASDGLYSTICAVNVTIRDVNNHAPQFTRSHYLTFIAENTPIDTTVEEVKATDLDTGINAKIRYRIQQGSFDDFAIHNETGSITVSRRLDYDRRNRYSIEVVASDLGIPSLSGTTTLSIDIINSNDKDPYFTPVTQRVDVREDARIGTNIYQLLATDPDIVDNDALVFEAIEPMSAVNRNGEQVAQDDSFKNLFAINKNGSITVNGVLDRDLFAVVRLTVLVTDTTAQTVQQGKGLIVITIIEVNELPPVFAFPWSESSPMLSYQILEEQPIGTILTALQATDTDSNIDEYRLEPNNYFEINNMTGVIRTKARIDYEQTHQIRINAIVTDTGIPQLTSTAEILVDIINTNDNDPYFNTPEYKINLLENSPEGFVVGRVEAKDNDEGTFGDLTYSLIGDQSRYFNIDGTTGVLTVKNSTYLDRERQPEIVFNVMAADKAPVTSRRSAVVPIHIYVKDENDNKPVFSKKIYHASVAENVQLDPPAAVLQVYAHDADDGAYGEVKYSILSNDNTLFQLDPNSGILYPSKSLKGMEGQYELKVEARDGIGAGPFTDEADILIDIHRINNYRPEFIMPASSNATIEVQDNLATENYLVMKVKATDNDTGPNGRIKYYLQANNQNVLQTDDFSIDENTGELRIKRQLDHSVQSAYELVLVARDQGTSSWFESLRFLNILLVSANENRPEFPDTSNPYEFFVTENQPRGIRIARVQAFTRDKDRNSNIHYYIILGNEKSSFYVDKNSGDLFTNRMLDREDIDEYYLFILASEQSDMHISNKEQSQLSTEVLEHDRKVAKVRVRVLDINDNPPIFEQDIYYAGVSAKSSINQLITVINATDADMGVNGTLDLIITSSNLYKYGSNKSTGSIVPSPFSISRDGRLTTATFMGEYNQDRFELTIVAKEIEAPERTADTRVIIWIFNPHQLIRIILSRSPFEVHQEREQIIAELQNVTKKRIIIDEMRYHVDAIGRIRMDWCDLFFHAVEPDSHDIVPVDNVLKVIDAHYDILKDYYGGFAIENIVPAQNAYVHEEMDLALTGLIALLVVLFVGAISFLVLSCCLRNWSMGMGISPLQTHRKDALIKKQFVEELSTTENPLWIEQKLKMYEEQELTMQVFSEPEMTQIDNSGGTMTLHRRHSYETSQIGDNTYATILPRSIPPPGSGGANGSSSVVDVVGGSGIDSIRNDLADYATLRNNDTNVMPPAIFEFTGSTFQAPLRDTDDSYVTELIQPDYDH